MENENEIELMKKKANAYFLLGDIVHIIYKKGFWKRGIIIDVKADFFMLEENIEGTMPVFYQEINSIEKFIKRRKEGEHGTT